MHGRQAPRQRGAGGFTLVELLAALAVMGLVASAAAAISLGGVLQSSDGASERHLDGSTAQFVARTFASDVQGAARVSGDACTGPPGAQVLLTLEASATTGPTVSYLVRPGNAGFDLIRATCRGSGAASSHTVARDLLDRPRVSCDGRQCDPGSEPRSLSLAVTRTDRFGFELLGSRRGQPT
jgi:prepilin-type N-terminal cleavage/methylation domain-containing protein